MNWPAQWPMKLKSVPPSFSGNQKAEQMFMEDTKHWFGLVADVYLNAKSITWPNLWNIMDMNADYGG